MSAGVPHPAAQKYLVATDHLEDDRLRVLTVADLFDMVVRHGLHFDQSRRSGVVFHMISCLTECGRDRPTAVGDNPEYAWRINEEAQSVAPAGGGAGTRGRIA